MNKVHTDNTDLKRNGDAGLLIEEDERRFRLTMFLQEFRTMEHIPHWNLHKFAAEQLQLAQVFGGHVDSSGWVVMVGHSTCPRGNEISHETQNNTILCQIHIWKQKDNILFRFRTTERDG
jgi:hypothetical protein